MWPYLHLQVIRVVYAVWALVGLAVISFMWSLMVLAVLLVGITGARSKSRVLLLVVRDFLFSRM